jgi:hypothetical protein
MTITVPTTYPHLYVQADLIDDLMSTGMEFLWPESAGPFEKIFMLLEYGTFLIPGVGMFLEMAVLLSSLLGYGLRDFGRWLDNIVGVKDFDDLADKSVQEILDKVIGKVPAEKLNEFQTTAAKAGIISAPPSVTSNLTQFPLVKKAKEPDTEELDELLEKMNPQQRERYLKETLDKGSLSAKETAHKIEGYDNVKSAKKKWENTEEGPKKDKALDKLNREREKAKQRHDYSKKSGLEKAFAGEGKRLSTVNQAFRKGILGGIVVSFTNMFGGIKDLAFKLAGKFPKLTLLATVATTLGGAAYTYFKFTDDSEPEPGPQVPEGGSVFTPSMNKNIKDISKAKGTGLQKEPSSFEEAIALQINLIGQKAESR